MRYVNHRTVGPVLGVLLMAMVALASVSALAQTALSVDGAVESTWGGFQFPDGTVQTTALSVGSLPDTGQQECWDAAGDMLDSCSGTGQDGELQKGIPWPAPRFMLNGDGTVTDHLTGLTWLEDANCMAISPATWESALASANGLMMGDCGLSDGSIPGDWRLPNIRELLSLVDYGAFNPAIPLGHPFDNIVADIYWSSTTVLNNTSAAWIVDMRSGNDASNDKTLAKLVWPVKGGQ